MVFFLYILLACIVVFLALKLSKYVDLIDKTTKVSGAFIGGVLLAAVTSLPELFTSISATLFINENDMVIGNILGSNIFNTVVVGLALVFFIKRFKGAKLDKTHIKSIIFIMVIMALVAVGIYLPVNIGWFNLMSPFILVVYIIFIVTTPSTKEKSEKFVSPISFKQIIIRFTIASVLLVAASICITYVSDSVALKLGLGKTFAGALLLGVATSLPELASTLSLCKKGNFDAGFGNVMGSNIFNFVILFLSDMLSFKSGNTSVYANNFQSMFLLIFGGISTLLLLGVLIMKIKTKVNGKGALAISIVYATIGVVVILDYILFIIFAGIF